MRPIICAWPRRTCAARARPLATSFQGRLSSVARARASEPHRQSARALHTGVALQVRDDNVHRRFAGRAAQLFHVHLEQQHAFGRQRVGPDALLKREELAPQDGMFAACGRVRRANAKTSAVYLATKSPLPTPTPYASRPTAQRRGEKCASCQTAVAHPCPQHAETSSSARRAKPGAHWPRTPPASRRDRTASGPARRRAVALQQG